MIEAAQVHRYFLARYVPTDVEVRLMNGDVRYGAGEGEWGCRIEPDGDRILVTRTGLPRDWGFPARLDELEPLPDGRGLWHPHAWEHGGSLRRTFEGSWRQYAEQQGAEPCRCELCAASEQTWALIEAHAGGAS